MPLLRSAFIALSHNRPLRRFCEHSALGTRLNSRFIAGMEPEDALRVAESVNHQGISVTLDSLGESVTSRAEAHRGSRHLSPPARFHRHARLKANISVKLTQMGLEHSPELAESIAGPRRARAVHGKLRAHRHGRLAPDASHARHRAPHPCTPGPARRRRRSHPGLPLSLPGRHRAAARRRHPRPPLQRRIQGAARSRLPAQGGRRRQLLSS